MTITETSPNEITLTTAGSTYIITTDIHGSLIVHTPYSLSPHTTAPSHLDASVIIRTDTASEAYHLGRPPK